MFIEQALNNAEKTKELLTTKMSDKSVGELLSLAGSSIEELMEIIHWYDKNQRRLIKALVSNKRRRQNDPS